MAVSYCPPLAHYSREKHIPGSHHEDVYPGVGAKALVLQSVPTVSSQFDLAGKATTPHLLLAGK